jgi:hypothetical protein
LTTKAATTAAFVTFISSELLPDWSGFEIPARMANSDKSQVMTA